MSVKILHGEDVVEAYRKPSNHTFSSMSGDRFSDFIGFYADSPEKVGLVVAYDDLEGDEKMTARALIWYCDNGNKVLDGIYGCKRGVKEVIEWCSENEIVFYMNITDKNAVEFAVTMEIKRTVFPFIDTFMYGVLKEDHKTVVLYPYFNKEVNIVFCSHEGYAYSV